MRAEAEGEAVNTPGTGFPPMIYVKHEGEDEEPFLIAVEDVVGLAELGETVTVGVYVLQHVERVTGTVEREKVL